MMQARDAAGRLISLLHDSGYGPVSPGKLEHQRLLSQPSTLQSHSLQNPRGLPVSLAVDTPDLLWPAGFDLNGDSSISPLTPPGYVCGRAGRYAVTSRSRSTPPMPKSWYTSANCYDSPAAAAPQIPTQRPIKRFFCRFYDSHGCEKTFTTSSHASRHAKTHMARATIRCTYKGCLKRFTRADNMKQHLAAYHNSEDRTSGGSCASKSATSCWRGAVADMGSQQDSAST